MRSRLPLSLGVLAIQTRLSLCEGDEEKKSSFESLKLPNFENLDLKVAGKSFYELIESGSPGKIGYGFMMGYSSGFCLKKARQCLFSLAHLLRLGFKGGSFRCWGNVHSRADPLVAGVPAGQSREDPTRSRGQQLWWVSH
jgi:hypothetical protein